MATFLQSETKSWADVTDTQTPPIAADSEPNSNTDTNRGRQFGSRCVYVLGNIQVGSNQGNLRLTNRRG